MPESTGVYTTWVLVRPAEDLPGTWVAHALDFDVVSHGNNADHAIQMLGEAVAMVLTEDRHDGWDPYARRAPAEYWTHLRHIIENGDRFPSEQLHQRALDAKNCEIAISMWFAPRLKPTAATFPIEMPIALSSPQSGHPAHC